MSTVPQNKLSAISQLEDQIQAQVATLNGVLSQYASNGLAVANAKSRAPGLLAQISTFSDYCRDKMIEAESKIQEIKDQRSSDEKLKAGYEGYMKDQKKRYQGYSDNKEKYYNLAKAAVSDMKPAEFKKLNSSNIEALFAFLFELLWSSSPGQFKYGTFKKLAFGSDSDDFLSRLAVFDLNKLHKNPSMAEQLDRIRKASYPETNTCGSLSDLLAWMDYMHESYLSDIEARQELKIIQEQEAKFGERIMKVQVAQSVIAAHLNTVNYLKRVLEQLADIEKKIDVINKYDDLPHQAASEGLVERVMQTNEQIQVTQDIYN